MQQRFVMEAVMLAIYGQLVVPSQPVHYIIPYSTLLELYDLREGGEPLMPEPEDDKHAKKQIGELIAFFEEPLNRKKIQRALLAPWRHSAPLVINDQVTVTVIHALEHEQYGERFDPIETELALTAIREQAPLLTDQLDYADRLLESEVPVQIYDVEDFEFAVEQGMSEEHMELP